jgi:hypothetical protein
MSLSKNAKNAKQGSTLISKFRLTAEVHHVSVTAMLQDPSNRDEEGVMVNEVSAKAAGIEGRGFDFDKVRVVPVQMPLEKHKRDIIFANKDDRYPAFDENRIKYSFLGGNHLPAGMGDWMQMITAETPCASFCSVKGADGSGDEPGALQSIQVSENQTHVLNTLESDKQCILR